MHMQQLRAVLVVDFDAGTLKDVMEFDETFKKLSKKLCKKITDKSVDKNIEVKNHQAEALLAQRRGPTGKLRDIIFRGTRGPNKKWTA